PVGRLVEAAIRAVAPQLSGGAGVDGVGVARIDDDARDPLRLREPHVLPALAAVDGLVDAVADGDGIARPRFARSHPDDLRILRIDLHLADRLHRLLVEDGLEGGAAVLALPDPAARRSHEQQGLSPDVSPVDGGYAAAHRRRPDVAGVQSGDDAG